MKTTILISGAFVLSASVFAQAPAKVGPGADLDEPLPVRQVTLFSSGVAYTERRGTVDGEATVPLTFRTSQINDVLKSLVLIDTGGTVQPAVYPTRDPISHTLKSFTVDVTQNINQQEILAQLKGSAVEIDTEGKPRLTGRILGVESRQVAGEDGKPINAPFLSLLTDTGIVVMRLDTDKTVRLSDAKLDKELRDALALLATGSDDSRRRVTLKFSGVGKREVRIGYVAESSIWKVSYRLLLGGIGVQGAAPAKGNAYLQGWAIVENTTDEDWNNVQLSLVSGRPVSFIQDLYQPLYLPRPVVGPDVVASLAPQTHDDDLQDRIRSLAVAQQQVETAPSAAASPAGALGPMGPLADKSSEGRTLFSLGGQSGGGGLGFTGNLFKGAPGADSTAYSAALVRSSVASAASGEKAGEQFAYNIKAPITLPRQQASMIPVITHDLDTTPVSIFNAESGSRFPLLALRIHNDTGEQLKAGPITLFDNGVYAGDAKVEDIPIDGTRLLSYAVDLDVECEQQAPAVNITEASINLNHGVLIFERKQRTETNYTVRSRAQKPKTVVIEHPFAADYALIAPAKADERTTNLYRFNVRVAPGQSETLKVVTEQPQTQQITIMDSDSNVLSFYTNRAETSEQVRGALKEIIVRRTEIQKLNDQAADRSNEMEAINKDQDRIRKNMAELDRASALYKRYVDELDKQETQIHTLSDEITKLKAEAQSRQDDLKKFVTDLQLK